MKRLFYFLSKTDPDFISLESAAIYRSQQLHKGVLVLLSGLLSYFASSYAIYVAFRSTPLALCSGVAYGVMITFFGRLFVSSREAGTYLTAFYISLTFLLLMVMSSFLIAMPLQLRLFDSEIRREITNSQVQKEELLKRRVILEHELDECQRTSYSLGAKLDDEVTGRIGRGTTGIAGHGPVYRYLRERYERNQLRCNELIEKTESARKEEISYIPYGDDFSSGFGALKDISSKSQFASWAYLMTALLLAILQWTPILIVWFSKDNTYIRLVKQWRARLEEEAEKQIRQFSFAPPVNPIALSEANTYPGLTLPSFGSGFASGVDWFGDLAPTIEEFRGGKRTLDEARDAAIARDWAVVGQDLQKVLDRHGEESTEPNV
ncbi:MAG: DUF4407 domain-containing protein [Blastocatellia bacterium]